MNGYVLLAAIVQFAALCGLAAAIWHHAKYASAVALGGSVTVLSFSLDAVRNGALMSLEFLGSFVAMGGMSALSTLMVIAAVVRRMKSRSRQANATNAVRGMHGNRGKAA